ncbi:MAG: MurR/RpiR family transcriptional regulator [Chloroflexi bacterium HGW-Chloroflexi-3]|nr:MAG: MurR/RpiR family transcriptional regulator [Chloroflexi bacterium HGW-Chloroflexi-3]
MDQLQNFGLEGDTLARLRGLLPSLSPAERKIGEYVLDNSEKIIRMTLAKIANQAGVSDATAVRFCRTLGYEGWLEFKIALIQALPYSPQLIHSNISIEDDPVVLARKVLLGNKQALDETLALLDEDAIQKALNLLSCARLILIVAVGTSGPMAHEMYNRLLRLGMNCQVQTDSYLQVMQVSLLTPQDVLVVISQTGDSYDPRRTAAEAKRAGVPVICITGNTLSPITTYADVVLLSVTQESMPETISSRIAQYALIHALYICLAMKSMDQTIENEQTIWKALMRKFPYQAGEF